MVNYTFVINHPVYGLMPVVAKHPSQALRQAGVGAVILTAYITPEEALDEFAYMYSQFQF